MRRAVLLPIAALLAGCSGSPPGNLGVQNQKLAPCPDSPNCVSSFATDPEHKIAPLAANLDQIKMAVAQMDRAEVIQSTSDYLHVEFTSAIFRFIDDVEFLYDDETALSHVRSASRIGHSDLGVNRKRVETIRKLLDNGR